MRWRLRRTREAVRRACALESLEPRWLLTTIYVDTHAPAGGPFNGASWATAYTDLAPALSAAISGDEIHVADGTYKPGSLTTSTYTLKAGVTLLGGYAGYAAPLPDDRNIAVNITRLSGDIGTIGSATDNISHILTATNLSSATTIDGFVISDGNANNDSSNKIGGGIRSTGSELVLRNCTFSNNTADRGGAIRSTGAISVTDCVFTTNTATTDGGAVETATNALNLSFTRCSFTGNQITVSSSSAGYGGAMYISGSSTTPNGATVTDCTFTNNNGTYGGALYAWGKTEFTATGCAFTGNNGITNGGGLALINMSTAPVQAIVRSCTFSGNTSASGAGLYVDSSSPTIDSCIFANNISSSTGGGIMNWRSNLKIYASVFRMNSAGVSGGGLYNFGYDSSAYAQTIVNCLFVANTAQQGAAAQNYVCSPTYANCTMYGNIATTSGGAMYSDTNPNLFVTNCIVWGNVQPLHKPIDGSSTMSITYSDVEFGFAGATNVNINPQFVDADGADNMLGTADDNLRLSPVSPLVDAGNNTAPGLVGETEDADGGARYLDVPTTPDTGVSGGSGSFKVVDMGAYEAAAALDARIDGPYRVRAGRSIVLSGLASSDVSGAIDFAWDLDNDGQFDDATGHLATFNAPAGAAMQTVTARLRITDGLSRSVIATTAVVIVPEVLYVDDSAPGGGNGASWNTAYRDLNDALSAAALGSEIRVGQGTYKPTSGTDRTRSFFVGNEVTLNGSYAGFGAPDPNARDFVAFSSTLSGDIGAAGAAADNSYNVVSTAYDVVQPTIDGFVIRDGNANVTGALSGTAGGIISLESSLKCRNCQFLANNALNAGAIFIGGGSLDIASCSFVGNSGVNAGLEAGAISCTNGSVLMVGCTFTNNTVVNSGGAIKATGTGSFTATRCTFTGNTAHYAGAIYCTVSGASALTDCTFTRNSATATSNAYGGAYGGSTNVASFTRCAFRGNTSNNYAAAIWTGGQTSIFDCLFAGNSTGSTGGGAIYVTGATTVAASTFASNVTTGSGGAIYTRGALTVSNSILWKNSGSQVFLGAGGSMSASTSDFSDTLAGNGSINADPLFVRNPATGVDGVWGTSDDDYGDLHLLPASACIDAGGNATIPAGLTLDLDHDPRVIDTVGVRDPGAIIDMGAFERQLPLSIASSSLSLGSLYPKLLINFSSNLDPATLSDGDLQLRNQTSNQSIDTSAWSDVAYDADVPYQAAWSFNHDLPDGNYLATLAVGSLTNLPGQTFASDATAGFFILTADANHDRYINSLDFNALAANFNKTSGVTFSGGDFNYDGKVNALDFNILATKFGTYLAPLAASAVNVATPGLATPTPSLFTDRPIAEDPSVLQMV